MNFQRAVLLLSVPGMLAQTWTVQQSGTSASLRGISAVTSAVAWASGSNGTWLRTTDGGATWQGGSVPGGAGLDFRDVYAVDARTAFLLSSGDGPKSRVYKTVDGGEHWSLQFENLDRRKGFFDAFAFWNGESGLLLGDPVDDHFVVLLTENGGITWQRQKSPPALRTEGAFAASGTCIAVHPGGLAWFGTGGIGGARVFRSNDGGHTWMAFSTPVRNDASSAGIFSLAFSDGRNGVAVGGDYAKPSQDAGNIAITTDAGETWIEPPGSRPKGYRSAVAVAARRGVWIAAGTSGSDISTDGGRSWKPFDTAAYNAVSLLPDGDGWAAGPKGAVARLKLR